MAAPILSYEGLGLIQGNGWLFRGLDLFVGARDRLALIGRNGAGKTILLKCLAGLIETDEGRRTIQPGIRVVLLEQDPPIGGFATLRDFALAGPPGKILARVRELESLGVGEISCAYLNGELEQMAVVGKEIVPTLAVTPA